MADSEHAGAGNGGEQTDFEGRDERLAQLQSRYRFYILNPPNRPGVSYSLHIQEDDYEYPVLSSNTDGFPTFNSRSKTVGEGIEPTEEFFTLIGVGFHEAMAFMLLPRRDRSLFDRYH